MEGLWGTALALLLIYPIAYFVPGSDNGSYEDPWDAIAMIQNSKMLQVFKDKIIYFVNKFY
jgi:hypothetical protein